MATPINGFGGIRPESSTREATDTASKTRNGNSAAAGATSSQSGDQVSLTADAERIRKMQTDMQEQPAIDQAKVDRIKQMITDGEYQVDAEKVADKFMELELSVGIR